MKRHYSGKVLLDTFSGMYLVTDFRRIAVAPTEQKALSLISNVVDDEGHYRYGNKIFPVYPEGKYFAELWRWGEDFTIEPDPDS